MTEGSIGFEDRVNKLLEAREYYREVFETEIIYWDRKRGTWAVVGRPGAESLSLVDATNLEPPSAPEGAVDEPMTRGYIGQIKVDNLEHRLERALSLGGEILGGKEDEAVLAVRGIGKYCFCIDPYQNVFQMFEPEDI